MASIPRLIEQPEKALAFCGRPDSDGRMIRGGFLSEEDRKALIALARDGSAAGRVTRRANALALLDGGMSCQEVAEVLFFDDDTIRGWYELFERSGLEGLTSFDMGGSSSKMSAEQAEALKAWVTTSLPRSTRHVGAWIEKEFGLVYESRSGLIALLHRLRLEYHKPEVISRKLKPETQKAFIASYEDTLNSMGDNEAVVFMDAVPSHPCRAAGGLLGAQGTEAGDRTDERAHQHSRRDRPGNRPNPHARSRNDRRDIADTPAGIAGIAVPFDGLHPCFPGQRALSPRQARQAMAGSAGMPDQAAFPSGLLPAFEPDGAAMGSDAQKHHTQQVLSDVRRVRRSDPDFPARRSPNKVGRILRFGHRQLPYYFAQGFSAPGVNRVYIACWSNRRAPRV